MKLLLGAILLALSQLIVIEGQWNKIGNSSLQKQFFYCNFSLDMRVDVIY